MQYHQIILLFQQFGFLWIDNGCLKHMQYRVNIFFNLYIFYLETDFILHVLLQLQVKKSRESEQEFHMVWSVDTELLLWKTCITEQTPRLVSLKHWLRDLETNMLCHEVATKRKEEIPLSCVFLHRKMKVLSHARYFPFSV